MNSFWGCGNKNIQHIQKYIPLKVFRNPEFVLLAWISKKRGSLPKLNRLLWCYWKGKYYSVPYKRKKVRKVRNFSGIFALKFCEFRRFCFPPKTLDSRGSRRLALVCRRNRGEKLQNLDEGPFFFFLEITFKPDKNDEKIFGIFTLSLERSHYFRHFRRRWKLRGNTIQSLFFPGNSGWKIRFNVSKNFLRG